MENQIDFREFDNEWEQTAEKCPDCGGYLKRFKCETIDGRFDYIFECVDCRSVVA